MSSSPIVLLPEVNKKLAQEKCVQVYFDEQTPSAQMLASDQGSLGRIYANMTLNLLAHFSEYKRFISPITAYQKGDIEKCPATLYLGSDYYSEVPMDFVEDFKSTKKRVAWLGYSFWDLGEHLEKIFGVQFESFTELDTQHLTIDQKPTFFRDVLYKGEVFTKYNDWNAKDDTQFLAAYEVAELKVVDSKKSKILAQISHSATNENIPWALQAGTKFIITEIPLSFIHESDRYLVFADLLFDILDEKPIRDEHLAVIRLEDLHPFVDLTTLAQAVQIMKEEGVTPHLAIIPAFKDPLGSTVMPPVLNDVPIYLVDNFHQLIQEFSNQGSVIIWHGITHQYNQLANPYSGASADDFEFWDAKADKPIAEDSVEYIRQRLGYGADIFRKANLDIPQIWLTPHYKASALDNLVFADYFKWTIGRMTYFNYNRSAPNANTDDPVGQFFPYEIYNDIYGQRVIPENLGNVQNELNSQVTQVRTVEQILKDAKRNKVLRDSWASVFFHPFLLADQDPSNNDLRNLVTGLKKLGYHFINLNSFVQKNVAIQPTIRDQQKLLSQ
jgi:uncharacterized protein YdaL